MRRVRVLSCRAGSRTSGSRTSGSRTAAARRAVAVAVLAAVMLVVPVTGGFTSADAVGERTGTALAQTQRADGQAEKAKKKPELKVPESFHLVPADQQKGDDWETTQGTLRVEVANLGKSDEAEATAGEIKADFSDLAGKVDIDPGGACARDSDTKFDCPYSYGYNVAPTDFTLRALKSARADGSESVRFTWTSPQGEVFKASTKVVIGRPQLGVRQLPMQKATKPGGEVEFPLVFRNMGEVTARGIVVSIGGKVEPSPAKRHRNCRYDAQGKATTCSFPDARVRPGETWTLKPAPTVRTSAPDMYERFDYSVAPLDDPDTGAGRQERKGGEPGQGSTIRLVKTSEGSGKFYTGNEEPPKTFLLAQRDTHIDYEAIAASTPDDEKTRIRVGIRNNGPGAFAISGVLDGGRAIAKVRVTLPPGIKVQHAPREVNHVGEYDQLCKRRDRIYTCSIDVPERGETDKSLEFLLYPTEKSGKVRVELPDEPLPRRDPESANDTATVTIRAASDPVPKSSPLGIILVSIAATVTLVVTRRRWVPSLRRILRLPGGTGGTPSAERSVE
jgi:hypothetical protein